MYSENFFTIKFNKMKATRLNQLTKGVFLSILMTLLVFSFTSSAQKIPFLTSTITPAAQGYVKVKQDSNKNYVVKIHISDLAEIERMQPTKKTYVAWMVTDRDVTKNIGRVSISKNLTGYLETLSSFKPIKIFITAEVDESVPYPGEQVVLTTDTFYNKSSE